MTISKHDDIAFQPAATDQVHVFAHSKEEAKVAAVVVEAVADHSFAVSILFLLTCASVCFRVSYMQSMGHIGHSPKTYERFHSQDSFASLILSQYSRTPCQTH